MLIFSFEEHIPHVAFKFFIVHSSGAKPVRTFKSSIADWTSSFAIYLYNLSINFFTFSCSFTLQSLLKSQYKYWLSILSAFLLLSTYIIFSVYGLPNTLTVLPFLYVMLCFVDCSSNFLFIQSVLPFTIPSIYLIDERGEVFIITSPSFIWIYVFFIFSYTILHFISFIIRYSSLFCFNLFS